MKNYLLLFYLILCASNLPKAHGQSENEILNLLEGSSGAEDSSKKKAQKEKKLKSDKKVKVKGLVVEEVNSSTTVQEYNASVKSLLRKGDKLMDEGSLYGAQKYYAAALAKTNKNKVRGILNYKLGRSAFQIRDYVMAEAYFLEAGTFPKKKKKLNDRTFYLALSLKHQKKYQQAKEFFASFITYADGNTRLDGQRNKARLEEKGCDYALELVVDPVRYTVKNPGENVNGPYADFGPELRNNELVYSKITDSSTNSLDKSQVLAQLYSAEMYQNKYNYAQDFSSVLNSGDAYVCNPSFSEDETTLYFTKCKVDMHAKNSCAIYSSTLEKGIWTNPLLLNANINEVNSSNSHPQIVQLTDGQELIYFTSDRVSGKGGKDIWYAYKDENGGFGRAKNIGSPINTKYDEVSPFYHNATNTMYFSTDGKASLGGLDVFKSVLSDEEWLSPENLETPINSSLDDYDFILNDNGTFGFLVSNREGTTTVKSSTCCDDVFEVNITQFNLFLKGLVYAENKDGRELMKNAKVSLRDITSGKIEVLAYNGKLFSALLEKESDYELTASSDDFESVISTFTTKGLLKTDTLHYDLFFNEKRNFDNKIVGVIYYEYNQARLTAEAPKTLEQVLSFLNAHPNMTVEVSAHTDGNGSASYNLNLSKERCEAASNYLNFNGISKDRLVKKWFGESQLKASELNEDGTDNREGRSLNRRTEFKVVEITN